jgi:palmitoyltransferase ZDHHC9/14/18
MPVEYMDISTRSTDAMLEMNELEPISRKLKNSSLELHEDLDNDVETNQSNTPKTRQSSQFAHLVPKKHNRMAKALELNQKNITETTFRFGDKYRYEMWEGKNKFICNGRIMLGAHDKHLLVTLALIVSFDAVFLGVIVPLLEIPLLFFIGLFIFVGNIIFLFLTAFTEPGIIPRRPPSKLFESLSQDIRDKVQYCHTCRIIRPPRAKHCRYCDNCVEVFDHHCPWTGTCIGVRNYGYFCVFVTLTTLNAAFACAVSSYLIFLWFEGRDTEGPIMTYVRDIAAPLTCVFTFLIFLLVGALLTFHLFLIGRQQTTNEFLRGVRPSNSDYKNSTTGNVVRLCCRNVPETKLLPMWERSRADDIDLEDNTTSHAISSLRSALENK